MIQRLLQSWSVHEKGCRMYSEKFVYSLNSFLIHTVVVSTVHLCTRTAWQVNSRWHYKQTLSLEADCLRVSISAALTTQDYICHNDSSFKSLELNISMLNFKTCCWHQSNSYHNNSRGLTTILCLSKRCKITRIKTS